MTIALRTVRPLLAAALIAAAPPVLAAWPDESIRSGRPHLDAVQLGTHLDRAVPKPPHDPVKRFTDVSMPGAVPVHWMDKAR